MRDVKTYLQKAVIASDGLLVVRDILPFSVQCERIVVPRKFVLGLLTAIHLRFSHPTTNQLKQVVRQYFYAINLDDSIDTVSNACDVCNSLKFVPTGLCVQSTSAPPSTVGSFFAFDVLKRERQLIAILGETVTSYTATSFTSSESNTDLQEALIVLSAKLKGLSAEIRVDPAPGLASLRNDQSLKEHGIVVDIGREKNLNKNPVAERAVQELEQELLKMQPEKGPVSQVTLALATSAMNSRVRRDGLSSRKLWTQRDQFTGNQFPVSDEALIQSQASAREKNHTSSALSKLHPSSRKVPSGVSVGDLVYLVGERSKLQGRDKYLVTSIQNDSCTVRKFTRQQFRKKEYVVPLLDLYPIVAHTFDTPPAEESSSDSDEEVTLNEDEHQDSPGVADVEDEEVEENVDAPEAGIVLRPRRETKCPAWHSDYDMGSP